MKDVKIIKVESTDKDLIVTIKINGKEMTHEISTDDPCIDCPMFIGKCAYNCREIV